MKKIVKYFLLLYLSLVLLTGAGCTKTPDSVDASVSVKESTAIPSSYETEDSVIEYYLKKSAYYEFFEAPSKDILRQRENVKKVSAFSILTVGEGLIRREIISEDPVIVIEEPEGLLRMGYYLPVYRSLISFVSNNLEMEQYLFSNGITGDVESVAIVYTEGTPVTIWVMVSQKNYFITINEKQEDIKGGGFDETSYVYRLYSHSDYLEKIEYKDAKLIVNGKDISSGNHARLNQFHEDLPFTAILQALGAKVTWEDKRIATITYEGIDYIFDIEDYSFYRVGGQKNLFLMTYGGYNHYQIIENELMVNANVILSVTHGIDLDLEIRVDREALVISISLQETDRI